MSSAGEPDAAVGRHPGEPGAEGWREAIWDQVPAGARPERFAPRRDFLLGHVGAGDRVLDVGCGDGAFAAELLAAGALVTAADVARGALRRAAEHAPGAELVALREDAPLPFADAAFDLVWAGETLEHVADVTGLLAELRRVLRAGGTLLVTTPDQPRLVVALEALLGRPLEDRLDPRADHLRFFTRRTLHGVLTGAGFTQVRVGRAGGLPLARQALHAVAR